MTQNPVNNEASQLTVDNLFLDGNTLSSTDTNGNIILAPDGSGEVSVTAAPIVPSTDRADSLGSATNSWDNVYADGLSFNDGTDILSTYIDQTSWTPQLEFGGATTGITYSTQEGTYIRIGNIVFVNVTISLSSKGSATGVATITGFPFTASLNRNCEAIGEWNLITFSANNYQACAIFAGTTSTISLQQCGTATAFTNLTDTAFANGSRLHFSMSVFI